MKLIVPKYYFNEKDLAINIEAASVISSDGNVILTMSEQTARELESHNLYAPPVKNSTVNLSNGMIGEYMGNKVFYDEKLEFGEVKIFAEMY